MDWDPQEKMNNEVRRIANRILVTPPGHEPAIDHHALREEITTLLQDRDRYHLWANHGHEDVYGDNGEMKCPQCKVDYKRDDFKIVVAAAAKARAAWEAWNPPQKGRGYHGILLTRSADPKFAPRPICTICKREGFASWKDALAHMRDEHPMIDIWWHKPFARFSMRMTRIFSRMHRTFQPKYRGARS